MEISIDKIKNTAQRCISENYRCPVCEETLAMCGLIERGQDEVRRIKAELQTQKDLYEARAAEFDRCEAELEAELAGANAIIKAIERLFPDWKNYRDLAEAVQVYKEKAEAKLDGSGL